MAYMSEFFRQSMLLWRRCLPWTRLLSLSFLLQVRWLLHRAEQQRTLGDRFEG